MNYYKVLNKELYHSLKHHDSLSEDIDHILARAAENGCLKIVKYVVEKGANIHTDNDYALRWAAYYGHLNIVKYLVEKGANIHADNDYVLKWAAANGHFEVVNYLAQMINKKQLNT